MLSSYNVHLFIHVIFPASTRVRRTIHRALDNPYSFRAEGWLSDPDERRGDNGPAPTRFDRLPKNG